MVKKKERERKGERQTDELGLRVKGKWTSTYLLIFVHMALLYRLNSVNLGLNSQEEFKCVKELSFAFRNSVRHQSGSSMFCA